MMMQPGPEHKWLEKLVGEWEYEHSCAAGPDQPAEKLRGIERVRSLGGMWVVGDGEGEMPGGGRAQMMLTLGYDPEKKKYVGSWVGSMMGMMWVYEGTLDESGRVLTLNTEGPNFGDGGKTRAKFKDVIEFKSDDHRVLSSHMQGPDGTWTEFMRADYRRKR